MPKKKAVAKGPVKLEVWRMRDKIKTIDIKPGVTTVAEAVKSAGYDVPSTKTAEEEGWRLNGKP